MEAQYTKLPKSRVLLNVEVEEEKVENAFKRACKNIGKKSNIPGFRKGKVPRKILERTLGNEVITEEAKNLLIMESYIQAVKNVNLLPLGEPQLDVKKFEEGSPMVFTAEVDVKPDVSLPDYKSINIDIEKEKFEVKEDYINESLNIFKAQLSSPIDVTERGIQKGDFVDLDIQIGHKEDNGDNIETTRKTCFFNESNFSEELIKEIEGMKAGEIKEFEVTEGTEEEKKILIYEVNVNSIKEFQDFELTDEIIQKNTKFATLEEVKENFRNEWEKALLEKKNNYIKESIIDKLVEKVEGENGFELPESLLNSKVNSLVTSQKIQLLRAHLSFDEYLKQIGLEEETYIQKIREEADKIIKTDLILEAIGEAEKIEIPEEEFKEAMEKLEILRDKSKIKQSEQRDLEDYVEVKLKKQKALDFLLKEVQISEN